MCTASAVPIAPVNVQMTDLNPQHFAATVEDLMGNAFERPLGGESFSYLYMGGKTLH
jgi:hypothetical protein